MYVILLPYSHLHCTKRIRNGVQILPFNSVGVLSLKSTSSPVQMLDVNKITLPATISSEEHDPIGCLLPVQVQHLEKNSLEIKVPWRNQFGCHFVGESLWNHVSLEYMFQVCVWSYAYSGHTCVIHQRRPRQWYFRFLQHLLSKNLHTKGQTIWKLVGLNQVAISAMHGRMMRKDSWGTPWHICN